jgi:hypothetical protein
MVEKREKALHNRQNKYELKTVNPFIYLYQFVYILYHLYAFANAFILINQK